jgi:SAM-dependent methyltransferase
MHHDNSNQSRTWIDDHHLRVGDALFVLDVDPQAFASAQLQPGHFPLVKRKPMIESIVDRIATDRVDNIVELGIFKGGSTVLYRELYHPKRLVAIELSRQRVAPLDDYIDRHSLQDVVHLHYGTRQGDGERLTSIVQEEFGGNDLDLVVDDCSHRYEQSKTSFDAIFPRLRPGGSYVIEDWGWAHWPSEAWQRPAKHWANERTPMSRLVLELVMVTASRPGLVSRIEIDGEKAVVTRGEEVITDPAIQVSSCYLTAGRTIFTKPSQLAKWPANVRTWLHRMGGSRNPTR